MVMSIKEARDNAKSRLNTTTTEIDHKAMFTEEQLEQIGYFVADSIKTILDKIEKNPEIKDFGIIKYLGNRVWSHAKLDSYVALCNEEIKHAGYENELVASWHSFDQRGNPNAYVPEADLITYHVQITEKN